jgi:hypothetical protein
MAEDNGN